MNSLLFLIAQAGDANVVELITGVGLLVAPPFLVWRHLDWILSGHNARATKGVFIAVGGLFSSILYTYLALRPPVAWMIRTPFGFWFAVAVASAGIYYWVFLSFRSQRGKVPAWVLPLSLMIYVTVLSMVSFLLSIAMARQEYFLVYGSLVDSENKPVRKVDASLRICDTSNRSIPNFSNFSSDDSGRFFKAVAKSDVAGLDDVYNPVCVEIQVRYHLPKRFNLLDFPSGERITFARQ